MSLQQRSGENDSHRTFGSTKKQRSPQTQIGKYVSNTLLWMNLTVHF